MKPSRVWPRDPLFGGWDPSRNILKEFLEVIQIDGLELLPLGYVYFGAVVSLANAVLP